MSVIVGWLVGANCADTLTVWGDKFVIGKNFWDPGIGRLLQIGKTGYQKNSSETTLTLGGGDRPHRPSPVDPPLLETVVTFRSLCERTTGCVCLSFLSNVRSLEQLVLVDTKKWFLGPDCLLKQDIVYDFRIEIQESGSRSEVTVKNC